MKKLECKKAIARFLVMAMLFLEFPAQAWADAKGTVVSVKVASPVVNGGKLVLKKGQKRQVKYTITVTKNASKKVTAASSNKDVVEVTQSGGKIFVKALKKGDAKITVASAANKQKKAVFKVAVGMPVEKLSIVSVDILETGAMETVAPYGDTVTVYTPQMDDSNASKAAPLWKINAAVSPANATYQGVKWKSSNPSLLTVSADGTVILHKQKDPSKKKGYVLGAAVVTAVTKDGSEKSADIKVKVVAKAGPEAGDITVLYTNDVHCAIETDEQSGVLGYAKVAAMKKDLEADGGHVVLVDAGDAVQGSAAGTLSDGAYIIDLMNACGYDLAIPGNHEFDYGMERFLELAQKADFLYCL